MIVNDGFNDDDVTPMRMEAFDWAARMALGPVGEAEQRAFDTWHASSPAHAEAYRETHEFMAELRMLDLPLREAEEARQHANVVQLARPAQRLNRRAFLSGSAVAGVAACVAGAISPPLGLWPGINEYFADERTGVGQRRSFALASGVSVELNASSSLSRVDGGLKLVAGEAFLKVPDRGRAFHVEAANARITATRAAFNVNDLGSSLCVTCTSGDVTFASREKTATLRSGEAATLHRDGRFELARIDPASAATWRRGLLIFNGAPLEGVIGEINRYYPGRLVLRTAELAARPVTGTFHVNQIELAVVQIQQLTGMTMTRLPAGIVLLG